MIDIQTLIHQVRMDLAEGKSGETIYNTLVPHVHQDPELARKLAATLGGLPDIRIAELLQRLLKISEHKSVRKEIKRSLYRLKLKGVSVEEGPMDQRPSILRPLPVEHPRGFGGGIDALGHRFLVLAIPHPGRGLGVIHGVISDTEGWISGSGGETGKKGFKTFMEEVRKNSPFPLVEIEPSYVAFLFVQASELSLRQGKALPPDYLTFKPDVEGLKKDYEKPLVYSLLDTQEVAAEDRWLRKAGVLLNDELLSTWRIEEGEVRSYAEALQEAGESKIVLTPVQKEARIQEIYRKALFELFSGDRKLLYQRRLEEMAYFFLKLGKEEEARISLAVALDLQKPLNTLEPNPFLFQLVVRSILASVADAYEGKREPSLIIRP